MLAEQEKEAARALDERVKEAERQEKAAALQREEQAAIQQQQLELQQQKERKAAQGLLVIKIFAVCAVFYALYLGRHWLKQNWLLAVIALIILLAIISSCIKEEEPQLSEQEMYERGVRRTSELYQKFGKEYVDEYIRKH